MAGYCTLVLYFHSPAARENTDAHSCNIQPYCLLSHQIIYMYTHSTKKDGECCRQGRVVSILSVTRNDFVL